MAKGPKLPIKERLVLAGTIVVAVLLIISLLLLTFVIMGSNNNNPISSNNIIGYTSKAEPFGGQSHILLYASPTLSKAQPLLLSGSSSTDEKLTLSWWTGYDGEKTFRAENLFPGDTEVKEYTVTVKNKKAERLFFDVKLAPELGQTRLSDVLEITVEVPGTAPVTSTFGQFTRYTVELDEGLASQDVKFKLTVSLPTSVNEKYMLLSLTADFEWTLEAGDDETTAPDTTDSTTPGSTSPVTPPSPPSPPSPPPETDEPDTTDTEPPVTEPVETDPPETEPPETDPPVTDPIETDPPEPPVTDPPETDSPEPPETDPIETTPPEPPEDDPPYGHADCCNCLFCHFIPRIFGIHNTGCIACAAVNELFEPETPVCVCPWCCIIFLIIILGSAVLLTKWAIENLKKKSQGQSLDDALDDITDLGDLGDV